MEIEKILKQLHEIEPDPGYARSSRARLMMLSKPVPKVTFASFMGSMLRSGPAMAAIGLLFFFLAGSAIWNVVITPVAGWDAKTLLAEAQAIDTQIHLVDLQYNDPGYERQRLISPNPDFSSIVIAPEPEDEILPVTTPPEADTASSTDPTIEDPNATSTPADAGGEDPNATSTPIEPEDTTVDVEEALDILSH